MKISSTQGADNGGGMTRTKTAYSKGVLTPIEIKAREELFTIWTDRKPEDSLELM